MNGVAAEKRGAFLLLLGVRVYCSTPGVLQSQPEMFDDRIGCFFIEPVNDIAAHLLVLNEASLSQHAQVMRDGWLGKPHVFRQLRDIVAVFTIWRTRQPVEQPQPHHISKCPQLTGKFIFIQLHNSPSRCAYPHRVGSLSATAGNKSDAGRKQQTCRQAKGNSDTNIL